MTTITNYGVKLSYFTQFIEAFGGREAFQGLTTTDVCEKFVKPGTADKQFSWIEHLQGENSPAVGVASAFISHAWHYHFVDAIDAMIDHFAGEEDPVIWFDLFCNNQHKAVDLPFEWWSDTFKSAIASLNRTIVVLSPNWDNILLLRRAWCLWEIFCTADTNSRFEIATTKSEKEKFITDILEQGSDLVNSMLAWVQSEHCLSTKPEDLESIQDAITKSVGFEAFDRKVRDTIREFFIGILRNSIATAPGVIDEKLGIPLSALQLRQQIGALYFQQEDYDKAEAENLEILNILKPIYGEDDDPLGFIIAGKKCLARINESQKKHDEAKVLFDQIVKVFQKKHGNIHPNTLLAQVELERFRQGADRDMNIDSEKLLLFLKEDDGTDKEEITLELLDMKVLFAQQLQVQEEFLLAEVFFRESYEKGQKHFGPDHTNVLTYQRSLGNLYTAKGDYEKGEEILNDCITRMKNTAGPTDPNTLVVVCDLATNLKLQKKFAEAEKVLVTSTDDCKALYSVDSVNTLHMIATLGAFYYEQEDYLKAFPFLETAATKGFWVFGPLDDRTVDALSQWDTCKKYVKAEEDKKREEALAHTKPPVKGWFYKQSKWLKAWRNRYIVVDENKLFIAKDESSKPHIIVPLTQSTSVRPISDMRATSEPSFYFEVKNNDGSSDVYYFYTSSNDDRQRWIEVIEHNQEE